MLSRSIAASVMLGWLAACQSFDESAQRQEPDVARGQTETPPWAAPGTCWGKEVSPAVVETVTEQVVLQPPQIGSDGTVISPGLYKTETRQAILRDREETWFETPCADVLTADFIASLQRALAARGVYHGAITGLMDRKTRASLRRYQEQDGLDSDILSLETARDLGLVAFQRPTPEA